ncbi:MAG: hypothetical protein H6Q90_1589, partial [Deltaproteobacteria bacterium]|nr:hypothetical protein [Deltaproteobacteria bacterium]
MHALMRTLLLVGLVGCWSGTSKPAEPPKPAEPAKPDPSLGQGGAFASLTGTGELGSGLDDANVYGGLVGDDAAGGEIGKFGLGSGSGSG